MTSSSWELPDNSPRRIVRTAPRAAAPPVSSRSTGRWMWLAFASVAAVVIGGAAYASRHIYLSRLDARYEKHCRALREARQWRELNQVSLKWVEENPSNMRATSFAAQSSVQLSRYDEAVDLLLRAPRSQPRLAAVSVADAAEIQFSMLNRPLEAEKNFLEALRLDPSAAADAAVAEARQRLIFYYAMTMQRKKMREQILEAIRLGVETRENYVYLIGWEWLIFSNGPQYNHQWRKSDVGNEEFNVARALGVVANGYATPQTDARMAGDQPSSFLLSDGSEIDPDAPADRRGREAHYEEVLQGYLKKYPHNLELLNYFLGRSTAAGNFELTGQLLAELPQSAQEDSRFWRHKASWQIMRLKRATDQSAKEKARGEAEASLQRAIELNPFEVVARHMLAGLHRETGDFQRVDRLEAIYNEGAEIRRLVLQAPTAHIEPELFVRIKNYVAICGQSDIADAMARRLKLSGTDDFLPENE